MTFWLKLFSELSNLVDVVLHLSLNHLNLLDLLISLNLVQLWASAGGRKPRACGDWVLCACLSCKFDLSYQRVLAGALRWIPLLSFMKQCILKTFSRHASLKQKFLRLLDKAHRWILGGIRVLSQRSTRVHAWKQLWRYQTSLAHQTTSSSLFNVQFRWCDSFGIP